MGELPHAPGSCAAKALSSTSVQIILGFDGGMQQDDHLEGIRIYQGMTNLAPNTQDHFEVQAFNVAGRYARMLVPSTRSRILKDLS